MARQLTAVERLSHARELIQAARDLPVPEDTGKLDLTYMANVRGMLTEARDLVKFISYSPSASEETKQEALEIIQLAEQAKKEIFSIHS
jgi:hypothetical protein